MCQYVSVKILLRCLLKCRKFGWQVCSLEQIIYVISHIYVIASSQFPSFFLTVRLNHIEETFPRSYSKLNFDHFIPGVLQVFVTCQSKACSKKIIKNQTLSPTQHQALKWDRVGFPNRTVRH